MSGFEWDEANVEHIARHGVTPQEVEDVFELPYVQEKSDVTGEERYLVYGMTARGRFLTVVITYKGAALIRPITAWNMTKKERQHYASEVQ